MSFANKPGTIPLFVRTDSSHNALLTTPDGIAWVNEKWVGLQSTGGYLDPYLTQYKGKAIFYQNLAGMETWNTVPNNDWILKDATGKPLFLAYGNVDPGSHLLSRYCADPGNAEYRQYVIAKIRAAMAKGWAGVFLDDVNSNLSLWNLNKAVTAPIDPRTHQPMTAAAWKSYLAGFVMQIRASVPQAVIVANMPWFSGDRPAGTDPNIVPILKASTAVYVEYGVAYDSGLTGDNGIWSVQELLRYCDQAHANGCGVLWGAYSVDPYNVSTFLLIASPLDVYSDQSSQPTNYPDLYTMDLGAPKALRYEFAPGIMRRDFEHGSVIVGMPGAQPLATTKSAILAGQNNPELIVVQPKSGFVVEPDSPIADGTYAIVCTANGRRIDIPSWTKTPGVQVHAWDANGNAANQHWIVKNLGSSRISLTSVWSGLCLAENAGQAIQTPWTAATTQRWAIETGYGGYRLRASSGNYLNMPDTQLGAKLTTSPINGLVLQSWRFGQ